MIIRNEGGVAGPPMRNSAIAEPEPVARVFAALASPARIVLLRALLDGPRTSQQLRTELDDPSVGQLYHQLRELLAAGLIIHSRDAAFTPSREEPR